MNSSGKQIFVFRHGETNWNLEGRFQGHIDIPLNSTGREQAAGLVPVLQNFGLEAILTSDLQRAHETGRIVAESLSIPIFIDPRLREAHLGRAQGLRKEEIEAQLGADLLQRWKSNHPTDADISYPDGESGAAVVSRTIEALEFFLKTRDYQRVGISTHGGVIRRLMHKVLPEGSGPVPIPNGVVYHLRFFDGHSEPWRVDHATLGRIS